MINLEKIVMLQELKRERQSINAIARRMEHEDPHGLGK